MILDLKAIETAQENETDMMYKLEAIEPPECCRNTLPFPPNKNPNTWNFYNSVRIWCI